MIGVLRSGFGKVRNWYWLRQQARGVVVVHCTVSGCRAFSWTVNCTKECSGTTSMIFSHYHPDDPINQGGT
jgi:hypothetical protein